MMSFSSLPIFIEVVECGSFSQAAKQLKITKSAVSKKITRLESDLGAQLLHRTTRKLSLTEAGKCYFEYAKKAVEFAVQGNDLVAELQGMPQGKLKIAAPMTFGVLHLAPLINTFLSLFPNIEIDLYLEDKMTDLIEGGFDVAIRIGHLPLSNLIIKRLSPCKSVLCASPVYFENHIEPNKPSDLKEHNCLQYSYFRGGSEWRFFNKAGEHRVIPKGNFSVNNSSVLLKTLLAGLGIAQMPTFIVSNDLAAGRLVSIMKEYTLPEHTIYAVFPERKHIPLKVKVFLDFIIEKLGSENPYWDSNLK